MKVSCRWLKEYVDLGGMNGQELAEKLTLSGIEVDAVEKRNQGVDGVVVGKVLECVQHPNADRLRLCQVDVAGPETLQIVCGASNVAAGQKVPVALVGATLPGNVKIKKAKLRGVESQGMICSAKELGLNDRLLPKELQEGILVLPEDTPLGASIVEVLDLDDEVLELDLTPNRSDCLSMIGTAYEVAAITGTAVRLPEPEAELEETDEEAASLASVRIEDRELCRHYAARIVKNVKVGPSPQWMQNRLIAAGIRPINNIVDITNYVMLEYGQPMHAFDYDKLAGHSIIVRKARAGETIVTLDDVERKLDEEMLVIADAEKPVAVAGVMGGALTQVTDETKTVLLESANFSGISVRLTSKKLGLRSESSLRFEKEADPGAVIPALNRAAKLLSDYAGGTVAKGIIEDVAVEPERKQIRISVNRINAYLGTSLTGEQVAQIFERLQFAYTTGTDKNEFVVDVPTRRGDIARDVDLIEEVARLYGYDSIPTTLPAGETTAGHLDKNQKVRRAIRHWLLGRGIHEAMTYSLVDPRHLALFPGMYEGVHPIRLAMPMSEEHSVLRTSLVPGLIDVALYNRNRNEENIAIFEIGHVFLSQQEKLDTLPQEKMMLALLWSGAAHPAHWSGKEKPVDFYDVKGIAEALFHYLGITEVTYRPAQPQGFHPGRTAEIVLQTEDGPYVAGRVGQLHPELQQERDLGETYVLELELEPIYELATFHIDYEALPRFPAVTRDIAVVVPGPTPVGDMMKEIVRAGGDLLESVDVFDVYTGENVGAGNKSVAFSLVYRHKERTLTDEEVAERQDAIVAALERSFGAELRKA